MKKLLTLMALVAVTLTAAAKDIKTVVFTTQPQMHCENCENKIKGNLKFEKGVKEIETNVAEQTVTIKYDADKTSPEKLAEGFAKINYTATVVTTTKPACGQQQGCGGCKQKQEAQTGCCKQKQEAQSGGCGGCKQKAEGGCCKQKQPSNK